MNCLTDTTMITKVLDSECLIVGRLSDEMGFTSTACTLFSYLNFLENKTSDFDESAKKSKEAYEYLIANVDGANIKESYFYIYTVDSSLLYKSLPFLIESTSIYTAFESWIEIGKKNTISENSSTKQLYNTINNVNENIKIDKVIDDFYSKRTIIAVFDKGKNIEKTVRLLVDRYPEQIDFDFDSFKKQFYSNFKKNKNNFVTIKQSPKGLYFSGCSSIEKFESISNLFEVAYVLKDIDYSLLYKH